MGSITETTDWKSNLGILKDFQRKTVNYVFRRLYTDENRVDRFLIADEVGLGKTLVARGVISKAIEVLKRTVKRVDIVYICSNSSIARQNINRLNITGRGESAIAERMTLLPLHMQKLTENRVNFVSFTPGTSFDLRSSGGIAKERALIYHILRKGWRLGNQAGPRNLLQGDVYAKNWKSRLMNFPLKEIDETLSEKFLEALEKNGFRNRFMNMAKNFPRARQYGNIPIALRGERTQLVGDLRILLARSCVDALEPDIVILDEFQRFRHLLDGEDEVGTLARAVFKYPNVKVILLSATPYKMYTMYHEKERDDHYADFLRTIRFLFGTEGKTKTFEKDLAQYRDAILAHDTLEESGGAKIKNSIESELRKIMVRTERLSASINQAQITNDTETDCGILKSGDLRGFSVLDKVASQFGIGDTVEYWKSAPYLLNIMDRDGYKIKRSLMEYLEQEPNQVFEKVMLNEKDHMLSWEGIRSYRPMAVANARLRSLFSNTLDQGAWKLLWIPPSHPYYQARKGPFAEPDLNQFTKALVFSSWMVVPKAIAMLTSYEAERRMVTGFDPAADYLKERNRPRLLDFKSTRDRLTGMSVFPLLYPCLTLAMKFDPLQMALNTAEGGELKNIDQMLNATETLLEEMLEPLLNRFSQREGRSDERWYWVALAALDWRHYRRPVKAWFNTRDQAFSWSSMAGGDNDNESRFDEHLALFQEQFGTPRDLGRPPEDLLTVIAKVAVASPAVAALRALLRQCNIRKIQHSGEWLLSSAAHIAMGFRYLFNLPESMSLIRSLRSSDDSRYWESVLDYCVNGNLQSVMDEYVHILRESLGLVDKKPPEAIPQIAEEIHSAVSVRTVNLDFDEISHGNGNGRFGLNKHSIMRCRFALRFGDGRNEVEKTEIRKDQVRCAFNSPFRPFVLATTSIGQEGLDFHQYCHSIYHWNLPSNPVDLEQREGRIHRYKCHMVRRNIAKAFPISSLKGLNLTVNDLWDELFRLAHENRESCLNDLVPYWTYEVEGGQSIKRYIPMFPLSTDCERLENLRNSLVAYRMILGQPRQEDLICYLQERFNEGVDPKDFLKFRIDLTPR
jgi:hypothetical protein